MTEITYLRKAEIKREEYTNREQERWEPDSTAKKAIDENQKVIYRVQSISPFIISGKALKQAERYAISLTTSHR